MAKPQLYSYWRSSCAWRVRIVLAMKGIEYDYKPVHLVKDGGEQNTGKVQLSWTGQNPHLGKLDELASADRKDEYARLNPMQQVPTLMIDGLTLTQSIAIIEYLDETRPDVPLLPKAPADRAQVRALCETIASGTQPLQNLSVLQHYSEDSEKRAEWSHHWIDKGFTAFEKLVSKTAGKFCFGDEVTSADVCLVPQIYNANRFKVDMGKFPTISRIGAELSSLDAFKAAQPDAQPDCPEKS